MNNQPAKLSATVAVYCCVLQCAVVCCSKNVPIELHCYRSDYNRYSRFEMTSNEDLKVSDQSHIDCQTVKPTQTSVDQRKMTSKVT